MQIAMIGAGYVGLVSAACLADFGHQVTCIDTDPAKTSALRQNRMPHFEPGLQELVGTNVAAGRLRFADEIGPAVADAAVIFIAVGTPSRRGDGFADLSFVYGATRAIAEVLTGPTVVVTKSTVPVGTGDEIACLLAELRPELDVDVVSNPEFLRQGAAIGDFKRPDRIVLGCESEHARAVMREVYRPLFLNNAPLLFSSRRAAELIKYGANAFLATKITFINEMADLCEKVGADIQEVARGIGQDGRIGPKFLHAGPGYGGSCFPKDTLALVKMAQDHGSPVRIVETVAAINDQRKRTMTRKIIEACGGTVRGRTIGLLGLTFKANTDDMRDAPSIAIVRGLQDAGAKLRVYDPEGIEQARLIFDHVDYAPDPYACAADAEALVIVTEWDSFRALDFGRLGSLMRRPTLIDLRNIYEPEEVTAAGFVYVSVGRAAALPMSSTEAWAEAAE